MRKGSELESLIRRVSQKLAEAQVMRLFKWPVDQIIQERAIRCTSCGAFSNGLSLLHTHRTGCDFFGYTSRGQHVALEAKGIAKPSLRIYCEEGAGVHIHQMLHLEEVARAGGKAVIVWRNDTGITAMEIRAGSPASCKHCEQVSALDTTIERMDLAPLQAVSLYSAAAVGVAKELRSARAEYKGSDADV